jgi:hypothetical protein
MSLNNIITSIKLRLLSVQSNDIVDIYQDINPSDLKIGENKIPITNPQIIRLLKNSSRVYKVSMVNEYTGMGTISKTGEDYITTRPDLLGYDLDSSDASSESGAIADMDASSESGAIADMDADADADASSESELHTDASSESGTGSDMDAESGTGSDMDAESELHTDASSESGTGSDMDAESELHTDASSESGASADMDAESELHTDASSDSETSMDSY